MDSVTPEEYQLLLRGFEPLPTKRRHQNAKPENAVLKACLAWLWANKVFHWRQNSGAYKSEAGTWVRYGFTGCPDIIAVAKGTGQFVGIECKAGKNDLSEHQKRFRDRLEAEGGLYIVARSVDELEAHREAILVR
jgi:hypothetical protein